MVLDANRISFVCPVTSIAVTPFITAVLNLIVLNHVAIGPEIETTVFVAEQNSKLAAVSNLIVSHDVVGIVVSDGNAVQLVPVDHIVFRQPVLDAPAPEDPLTVSLQFVASNSLAAGTLIPDGRRRSVFVVAVTVFDDHIMADLEADPVTVVVASCHAAKCVAIAVLHKISAIIAIEVFTVIAISIECDVFDNDIRRVLTGEAAETMTCMSAYLTTRDFHAARRWV